MRWLVTKEPVHVTGVYLFEPEGLNAMWQAIERFLISLVKADKANHATAVALALIICVCLIVVAIGYFGGNAAAVFGATGATAAIAGKVLSKRRA